MIKVKKPKRTLKPVKPQPYSTDPPLQHKVPKVVDTFKKIKPKEVFGKNFTNGKATKKK